MQTYEKVIAYQGFNLGWVTANVSPRHGWYLSVGAYIHVLTAISVYKTVYRFNLALVNTFMRTFFLACLLRLVNTRPERVEEGRVGLDQVVGGWELAVVDLGLERREAAPGLLEQVGVALCVTK